MTIDIRGYRASDLDQVASLLNRVLPDTQPHNEPSRSITTKQAHDDLMFVATTDSSIVGFIMAGYDGHRGWINYLATHPAHQKNGYGRAMMACGGRVARAWMSEDQSAGARREGRGCRVL